MCPAEVHEYCRLDDSGKSLLCVAMSQLGMSARAFHRILKLARTIADLEGAAEIKTHHLAEAIHSLTALGFHVFLHYSCRKLSNCAWKSNPRARDG
ncbi:MAG: hypothetical protein H5T63_01345 [Chloroflexi bacterium]|nr:hypothetical protein [Chloroflexota bacterium]